jgi:peptide deformylase
MPRQVNFWLTVYDEPIGVSLGQNGAATSRLTQHGLFIQSIIAYVRPMALLDIVYLPDPILRQVSTPVERVDDDLRRTLDDMVETMHDAPGIGLAAVQVGIPKRFLVLDLSEDDDKPTPLHLINPTIVKLGDTRRVYEEGCLSIPEVRFEIERPATCTVTYTDRDGHPQVLEADGLLATAIQHEMDHLDGKMIIDYMSKLKRDMVIRKFRKYARTA